MERVDLKVASIGEESARFERSIRHITVPGALMKRLGLSTITRALLEPPGGGSDTNGTPAPTADSSTRTLRGHCDTVSGLDGDLTRGVVVWEVENASSYFDYLPSSSFFFFSSFRCLVLQIRA